MWFLLALLMSLLFSHGFGEAQPAAREIDWAVGGVGGAYFYAQPGELIIEVQKQDLHRLGSPGEMRVILVGPDRQVLQDTKIPFDGLARGSGPGPTQRVALQTQVARPGVYGLMVTVTNDRYGDSIAWGFWTNCHHYLVETARGHRDRRHEEPLVLRNPGQPGEICFAPRQGAFTLDLSTPGRPVEATLYDARGALVAALQSDDDTLSQPIEANIHRDAIPWRLTLPQAEATVEMDGVTRWERGDTCFDVALWTPHAESWFPLRENRWLLMPYQRTLYEAPGQTFSTRFKVYNSQPETRQISLALEYPGQPWGARLSEQQVTVPGGEVREVTVQGPVPAAGTGQQCHVRVTPADGGGYSTYSTLTVQGGEAPASQPLQLPLQLQPYEHENEQFGYLPAYPTDGQVYFDQHNQPFIRTLNGVATLRDGQWANTPLAEAIVRRVPEFTATSFRLSSTKLAFDRDNDLYLVTTSGPQAFLLHSQDEGQTFVAYVIPGREDLPRSFDIEVFTGHNMPAGPPPILRYTTPPQTRDDKQFWRTISELELFLPRKTEQGLELGEPIMVSPQTLGLAQHSGIPNCVVSRDDRVHVVWGEATDPADPGPGVPAYVATWTRDGQLLGDPVLIGHGAPPNDVHNSPALTIDSHGYLHVLAGTHGRPFQYACSLQPDTAHEGFTEPVSIGENTSQTYIGLVCGSDDTLHLVSRVWYFQTDPYPLSSHGTLGHQRKRPGEPWDCLL